MNEMTVTQKNTYVGKSITHESAHLHVSGKANYVDDIPEVEGTLYAGLGLAEIAHGKIINMDLSAVWQAEGVVSVLTGIESVSYTHLRAHETDSYLVCRLLLEKKRSW